MLGVGACAEYGGGGELYVILEVLSDSACRWGPDVVGRSQGRLAVQRSSIEYLIRIIQQALAEFQSISEKNKHLFECLDFVPPGK